MLTSNNNSVVLIKERGNSISAKDILYPLKQRLGGHHGEVVPKFHNASGTVLFWQCTELPSLSLRVPLNAYVIQLLECVYIIYLFVFFLYVLILVQGRGLSHH